MMITLLSSLLLLGLISSVGLAAEESGKRHSIVVFSSSMIYKDKEIREKMQMELEEKFANPGYHIYFFFPDNNGEVPLAELNLREALKEGYAKERGALPLRDILVEYGKDSNSDKVTLITVGQSGSSVQVKRLMGSFYARQIKIEARTIDVETGKYIYAYSAVNEEPKKTEEAFGIAMEKFLENIALP
jgi:hypothetical protein